MNQAKTILTCAVTGNITTRVQHPRLPITPKEIATAAIEACRAGAAIVHLHARDPETGKGCMALTYYQAIVDRIRQSDCDVIINLTTGEGGRFIPDENDPSIAAQGTTLCAPEKRVEHIGILKPEICTLDFNTMISGSAVVINTPRNLERMANHIYAAKVKPEIEVFDSGDIQLAKHFLERGLLKLPLMFQIILGVRYGAVANTETLQYLVSQLPKDCLWAAFGIGRYEFPMLAQAYLLGGHVRVGLEDNIYISDKTLAHDNAQLVDKGVTIIENLGGSIATTREAREMLGLNAEH